MADQEDIKQPETPQEPQTVEGIPIPVKENHQGEGGGRPPLEDAEKNLILHKLQPYLQTGLSINKACIEAGVPKSTVYDHMKKDTRFAEEINAYKQFVSVMYNSTVVNMLHNIIKKVNGGKDQKPEKLSMQEYDFIKWFGTNSKQTKDEFGERKDIALVDPEAEIAKVTALIDEAFSSK